MKPEFFKDGTIAALSPVARLTYIGLWMLADDAGWFRLDVPAIGIELFGYDSRARRERAVAGVLVDLAAAGRIVTHECGHAQIPTLVDHQRFAGETKRVYTVKREHADCPRVPAGNRGDDALDPMPAGPRGSPRIPATVRNGRGQVRSGSVRSVSSDARKRDDESESEFRLRVGVPTFMAGKA